MGKSKKNSPTLLFKKLILFPTIWQLNETSTLLLFQDELMYMLRKLLLNIGDFPAQTSHILFNYLVSFTSSRL